MELMNLVQGNIAIFWYEQIQPTATLCSTSSGHRRVKVWYFEYGLRQKIGGILAAQGSMTTYAEIVQRVQVVVSLLKNDELIFKKTNTRRKRQWEDYNKRRSSQSETRSTNDRRRL